MTEITGGELFARALQAEGIEFLFGLPSPEADPLLHELEKHGIRMVPVRHEAAAVHMAEGLYKTTGKVAAVLGNPGPGSANLLPGALTALHEGVPVLVITSQHRMGIVYPSSPATFQGQDQLDLFRLAVKFGAPVFEWARIPEVLRLAFRAMWNGRPGPVHVELPAPILYATGDDASAPILPPSAYRGIGPQASEAQIAEAAQMLATAQRPVVISGSGVDRAGANAALLEIVELLGCPVLTTMAGRATVPSDHPNYVFGFGPAGDQVRREADVLLVVGSRVGNLDVPYDQYWGDPSGQRMIQIDLDPRHLGVTRPLSLGIVADARSASRGIADRLRTMERAERDGGDLARYRALDQEVMVSRSAPVVEWKGPGIHPAHAVQTIGAVFGSEGIYTVDGGNTSLWAYSYLPPTLPRSYSSILELGMLGTGIPSAIGAKLGSPHSRGRLHHRRRRRGIQHHGDAVRGTREYRHYDNCLCRGLVDDGRAQRTHSLWQDLRHRAGPNPLDLVAQGLGCVGEYVDRLEDLEPALRRSQNHDGPSLICLRTDHDANLALPMDLMIRFSEVYTGPAEMAPSA